MIWGWFQIALTCVGTYMVLGLLVALLFAAKWDQKKGEFDPPIYIFGWPVVLILLLWSFAKDCLNSVFGFYVRISLRDSKPNPARRKRKTLDERFRVL